MLRQGATEPPWSGDLNFVHENGVFRAGAFDDRLYLLLAQRLVGPSDERTGHSLNLRPVILNECPRTISGSTRAFPVAVVARPAISATGSARSGFVTGNRRTAGTVNLTRYTPPATGSDLKRGIVDELRWQTAARAASDLPSTPEVGFPAPKGFYRARASALSAQIGQGHSSRRCSNV